MSRLFKLFNQPRTENNAPAYSNEALAKFWAQSGAWRNGHDTSLQDMVNLWEVVYHEDKPLALRLLFYTRDCRGGRGEQLLALAIYNRLVVLDKNTALRYLPLLALYGRYKDFFGIGAKYEQSLLESAIGRDVAFYLMRVIKSSVLSNNAKNDVNLLAKWMPSLSAGKRARQLAERFCQLTGLSHNGYTFLLSALRNNIEPTLVETLMSQNRWNSIDYSAVPSRALKLYNKAFKRHSPYRWAEFMRRVQKGTAKVNHAALFPHEIVKAVMNHDGDMDLLDAQFRNFVRDLEQVQMNVLCVADTSSSMTWGDSMPYVTAISTALLTAMSNSGIWKDKFITFSSEPRFHEINSSESLANILNGIETIVEDTDLNKVFALILEAAHNHNLSNDDLPKKIIIVSDMQFNEGVSFGQSKSRRSKTNYEQIKDMYEQLGYDMPTVVFWNVRASLVEPVMDTDTGVYMTSGFSQTIFNEVVMAGHGKSSLDVIYETLHQDRYDLNLQLRLLPDIRLLLDK